MVNDLISDAITRIRNAGMRKLETTTLMHSKLVEAVVKIIHDKEYIESYSITDEGYKKTIKVILKYDENERHVINEVKRVSKPGRCVYKSSANIKPFKNGYGSFIISTSKGVMDNNEAHRLNIGGEILVSIW